VADYDVVTPPPVRKLIDALVGKRAGFQRMYHQLERDPCAPELGAYRLSGPLEPIVCGVRLDRGFRLAFTMQPAEISGERARVVILYVGQREPRHRKRDIWTILHDLFGVDNPPSGHDRPPCCERNMPEIDQDELDAFVEDLQRMVSGRRSPRRRRSSR
jgi:hypothetical protein